MRFCSSTNLWAVKRVIIGLLKMDSTESDFVSQLRIEQRDYMTPGAECAHFLSTPISREGLGTKKSGMKLNIRRGRFSFESSGTFWLSFCILAVWQA